MEKIQKALEKALGSDQAREPSAARKPALVNGTAARPAPSGTGSLDISYTATRVTPVHDQKLERQRLMAGIERHALSDTFRMLRTRVLNRMEASDYRTLGIASSVGQEGKTLVASNLAISLSKVLTRTVLLVDLDLRSPSVHEYFGVDPEPGLLGFLKDGLELSQCLVNPGIERLVLLPNGRPMHNSSELITMPRMLQLSKELRDTYKDRIVIYDLPPVLLTDDALAFMKHIDCCLLVAAEGRTKEDQVKKTVSLLQGYPLIGSVLNRSSETMPRYYGR